MELKDLKQGDPVIVSSRYFKKVSTIEKITPSGLIKVDGQLYNQYGSERGGDSFSKKYLYVATPEEAERINQQNTVNEAIRKMRNVTKLKYSAAVKILELLESE